MNVIIEFSRVRNCRNGNSGALKQSDRIIFTEIIIFLKWGEIPSVCQGWLTISLYEYLSAMNNFFHTSKLFGRQNTFRNILNEVANEQTSKCYFSRMKHVSHPKSHIEKMHRKNIQQQEVIISLYIKFSNISDKWRDWIEFQESNI